MLVVALYAIPAGVSRGAAQVSDDDLSMLGLVFRNRFVPFAEARRSAELTSIVLRVSELGRDGDRVERYKAMIEGMARMSLGRWDEGAEVASILDVDLSAKAYEPGARVPVRIAPLYERFQALMAGYSIQLALVAPGGAEVVVREQLPRRAAAGGGPGHHGNLAGFRPAALEGRVRQDPVRAPEHQLVQGPLWGGEGGPLGNREERRRG